MIWIKRLKIRKNTKKIGDYMGKKTENQANSNVQIVADESMKQGEISLEDQVIRLFNDVLETDEKIVKGFKPNKLKLFFSRLLLVGVPCLFILMLGLFAFFIPDPETPYSTSLAVMIVSSCLSAIIFCLSIFFTCLYYKNTYYVYTNKRVIIRTGVFGVDFKSLDLKNVGAFDVYVSLLDKILRKNTGTVKFGSNSSPINSANGSYQFAHIEKPYEVYKDIKEHINKI